MQSSHELQATALQEFDVAFGDVCRSLDPEGDFYRHFQSEFLKGVNMGVNNPSYTPEDIEIEGYHRQLLSAFSKADAVDAERIAAKVGATAFKYGAAWGQALVNGVGL